MILLKAGHQYLGSMKTLMVKTKRVLDTIKPLKKMGKGAVQQRHI